MNSKKVSIPFQISRKARTDLTTQVAGGLRSAIEGGVYAAGDCIPTILQLARGLGVSEIIARRAVQRLTREGLLNPRRGIGSIVAGLQSKAWRGRVLIVCQGGYDMYYQNVLAGTLAERLSAEHYLCNLIATPPVDNRTDRSWLNGFLDQSVTLAITIFSTAAVGQFFHDHHIDFIDIYPRTPSREAVRTIRPDFAPAIQALAQWAKHRHLHEVLQTRTFAAEMDAAPLLRAAGFHVRNLDIKPEEAYARPESVERAGLAGFQAWFAQHAERPDLILCTDDYIGRGALLALQESRCRVPEETHLVTWSNRGNRPLYTSPLSVIEMDPSHDGAQIAACALNLLSGSPGGKSFCLAPTFISDEAD